MDDNKIKQSKLKDLDKSNTENKNKNNHLKPLIITFIIVGLLILLTFLYFNHDNNNNNKHKDTVSHTVMGADKFNNSYNQFKDCYFKYNNLKDETVLDVNREEFNKCYFKFLSDVGRYDLNSEQDNKLMNAQSLKVIFNETVNYIVMKDNINSKNKNKKEIEDNIRKLKELEKDLK